MNKYVITKLYDILTGFYFEDNKLVDINCYEDNSLIGNIYVGKVTNIVKNINAAFINIDTNTSCYMPLENFEEKSIKIGDEFPVQVVSDKVKTKQMSVTPFLSLNNKFAVVSTNGIIGASNKLDNHTKTFLKELGASIINHFDSVKKSVDTSYGIIMRTDSESAKHEIIQAEATNLLIKLDDIVSKAKYQKPYSCIYKADAGYIEDIKLIKEKFDADIVTDIKELYEALNNNAINIELYNDNMISLIDLYGLKQHLNKALSNKVFLKSGGYLVIEPTEALTVIDVNSGKAIKGNKLEEERYKLNIEAAKEVARQIRIRNITGIVIVDFISMKDDKYNRLLLEELGRYVYNDPVKVTVVDITRLGLVEITRQKSKKSLLQIFNNKILQK